MPNANHEGPKATKKGRLMLVANRFFVLFVTFVVQTPG